MTKSACEICDKEDGEMITVQGECPPYSDDHTFCLECHESRKCIYCGDTEDLNFFNGSGEFVCSSCLSD